MGSNPSHFQDCGDGCPVENVSYEDVQAYIAQLNHQTGRRYRLPTEAEWEYACRAGGSHTYCGSNDAGAVAWYTSNSDHKSHPVGQKQSNALGLYDMSGNVWEWTCSAYTEGGYDGSESQCTNDAKYLRALRGGSWLHLPGGVQSANRDFDSGDRIGLQGFRLAQD